MEGLWAFVVIGGPIILLVALVAGWVLNRRRAQVPVSVTEAATRRNRQEEAADDKANGPH